ncbi:MAG TPA: hypothetical protein VLY46_13585 [Usitatibacter sp.]|nr:hypothetical protein [Usitatibacter sp.]
MRALLLVAAAALAPASALGVDGPQWPPPKATLERMNALEAVIRDPRSTTAQRREARDELAGLLQSPAGRAMGPPPEPKLPQRAAIEPYPSVVRPLPPVETAVPPPAGVAHLDIVEPPRTPVANPQTGSVAQPAGKFAIDPATGNVLHQVPGGYVDPRTGRYIPNPGR